MPRRSASLPKRPPRPSEKKDQLVSVAEDLFDRFGFHGTGIDRVIQDSGIARMTLYKHFPAKNALARAVIEQRDRRFRTFLEEKSADYIEKGSDPLLAIFDALSLWLTRFSSHGCLLLRAMGEFSNHDISVAGEAAFRKRQIVEWLLARTSERFPDHAPEIIETLGWELILLLEGTIALAPIVGGEEAIRHARKSAERLIEKAIKGSDSSI